MTQASPRRLRWVHVDVDRWELRVGGAAVEAVVMQMGCGEWRWSRPGVRRVSALMSLVDAKDAAETYARKALGLPPPEPPKRVGGTPEQLRAEVLAYVEDKSDLGGLGYANTDWQWRLIRAVGSFGDTPLEQVLRRLAHGMGSLEGRHVIVPEEIVLALREAKVDNA